MKRNTTKPWHAYGISAILLLLGFIFAINYSYYTKASASERGAAEIIISSANVRQSNPLVIDLAKRGQPKNLVQPNKSLARYTIKNETNEALPVTVTAAEFAGKITLQAGAATFEKPSNKLSHLINPGQSFRVNVSIDRSATLNQDPLIGELWITHDNTGELLGVTAIQVIDSEISNIDQSNAEHQHHQGGSSK